MRRKSDMKNDFKEQIKDELLYMFIYKLCMEVPGNIDEIINFVEKDVQKSSDKQNWTTEDVHLAFKRWISEQIKK